MIDGIHTLNVLVEVAEERHAQDERWGQQDHPVHTPEDPGGQELLGRSYDHAERWAKYLFSQGRRSWALIQLEEVFEALSARRPRDQRTEFIQVAAVAVAAVEAIDRAEAKKHGPGCELGMWHGGDCGPSAVVRAVTEFERAVREPVPDTFRPEKPGLVDRIVQASGPLEAPAIAHPWGGEGRLHGICRCGEGRDAAVHRCLRCDHPAHEDQCTQAVSTAEGRTCRCSRRTEATDV